MCRGWICNNMAAEGVYTRWGRAQRHKSREPRGAQAKSEVCLRYPRVLQGSPLRQSSILLYMNLTNVANLLFDRGG